MASGIYVGSKDPQYACSPSVKLGWSWLEYEQIDYVPNDSEKTIFNCKRRFVEWIIAFNYSGHFAVGC
jgi:hypothetical protein